MSHIGQFLQDGREYYEARANADIERNRKGDFSVKVFRGGAPAEAVVEYELAEIDFDFGCNIFMLDQYEDAAQEKAYRAQWLRLFNTAVIPFYWEGTEPQQGYLRYDGAANDVYRRPPAERVIEFCDAHGIRKKGHPLFWHEFIPKWLPESWDELMPLIEKRFGEISERFAHRVPVFDAVNEPGRIWDMTHEHRGDGYKMLVPPDGYVEQVFALAQKYFPRNELILNEAVGGALCEFKGSYGGYYQLVERLLAQGVRIDRVGLQCHTGDSAGFKNVFDARRFYGILDGYARLGRPLVLSEISISVEDEELQAMAAEQLYRICFSHKSVNGVFWWNLDDNGILTKKDRVAPGENLPYGGIVRNGRPKAAYRSLDRLINEEWHTSGSTRLVNGRADLRGFYGKYRVTVKCDGARKSVICSFHNNGDECLIEI